MNAGLHRDPPGWLKLSREVAIKVLPPAIAGRRFERETQDRRGSRPSPSRPAVVHIRLLALFTPAE